VLFFIFVAIFPELISGRSLAEAQGIYFGSWEPPSPDHLLGQGKFGRDVLALVAYGTRGTLTFGLGAVLIGLIGGLIFGPLASKFNRKGHTAIMSLMLVFSVLPGIVLVLLTVLLFGTSPFGLLMLTTGLLLIPGFTRIIANTEFRIVPIGKKIISYIPLFTGFAILLYATLGFLGFYDYRIISLGGLVNDARVMLFVAPWATFWPSTILFLIVASLFIFHEGLVKHSR
jgi:peptide/nickel transport system permease protein